MTSEKKPDTVNDQPNSWTSGGNAKTSHVSAAIAEFAAIKLDPQAQNSADYNPLKFARSAPEFIVNFLEQATGAELSTEKKATVQSLIEGLPADATMRDLYEAVKAQEADSLGISPDQYEKASPVLAAIQAMLATSAHAGLFK